jgi:hypothetical protein
MYFMSRSAAELASCVFPASIDLANMKTTSNPV